MTPAEEARIRSDEAHRRRIAMLDARIHARRLAAMGETFAADMAMAEARRTPTASDPAWWRAANRSLQTGIIDGADDKRRKVPLQSTQKTPPALETATAGREIEA